ncbi:MAG: efflux RND transporter periplasmic adaptor subunit [Bacteroidales bacterium]|nr:efflux RND transporter periplasmic adaptor subunit [Bacteroidales bacterium]MCF8454839.1 efflux RND transporter periplasmic adaptor subunit [Bacteroidales bacterium]
MKNIFQNIKENFKLVIGVLIFGLLLGWVFFHSSGEATTSAQELNGHEGHNHEAEAPTVWTCSMHPQFKMDEFGLCPICAMDLIPLTSMASGGDDVDPNEIVMSESAAKLASIQTMIVTKGVPSKTVYLQGKVQADERNIAELTSRFGGRIEKLFVNFTGEKVQKGQKLATIYSPGLVTAQRELLEAISFKDSRPSLYIAAKGKLKLWDLTDDQIEAIEEKGEPQVYFDVRSPISGTVSKRHVTIGDYVKEGTGLFEVIDLSKLWVMFDAYESDLPWIGLGDEVKVTVQALPGQDFTAKVSYIDPFLNGTTRVAKVRVELKNINQDLKPEMFAIGILESKIAESTDQVLIPKSSLLWTGKRAVVYVKVPDRESPSFLYRQVVLGPEAGAFYVIEEGLEEGEEIAVNGVFKIDAASQLQGLPSMMNPDAGMASSGDDEMDLENADEAFTVYGNCSMCKERIEKAAMSVKGVMEANWDENTKLLQLNLDKKADIAAVHKAIALVGHDTDLETASNDVYETLHECCKYSRPADLSNKSIKVYGNCGMCQERIETAALELDGIIKATWDSETGILRLQFDPNEISVDEVEQAIAAVGHDTENHRAPDDIYKKLPECCLYDRPGKK